MTILVSSRVHRINVEQEEHVVASIPDLGPHVRVCAVGVRGDCMISSK